MADDRDDTVVIERRSGGGIGLFLLGAAIGAGLALLFAPQSGEETRQQMRRAARRWRRKAEDLAEDGVELAGDLARTGREAASDLADVGRKAARDIRRTGKAAARDAREALEQRLARHREASGDAHDGEDDGV